MIIVIADDFTGAAEIAGIAFMFGLKTEVQTEFRMNQNTDLIIVDANTRSKTSDEAVVVMNELLKSIKDQELKLLYKKTDSVLRGHVYEELSILLKNYPEKSILLAPANPSNARTISNGTYFIEGQPLHDTIFGKDPEAPIYTSNVSSLINGKAQSEIEHLDVSGEISFKNGMIYVANVNNSEEVDRWAHRLNDDLIPAGAADFFAAILQSMGHIEIKDGKMNLDLESQKSLFICGSSLSKAVHIEEELIFNNPAVVEVSEEQICSDQETSNVKVIVDEVLNHYKTTNNVILTVNISEDSFETLPTHNIPKCLANIAFGVIGRIKLDEIFIEGGTTSSEVIRKIGWNRFRPVNQLGYGVIRMQVIDSPLHHIIVKPGSYKWPDSLWKDAFNTNQG
jgi:D-threonate/D-erythronate kinase